MKNRVFYIGSKTKMETDMYDFLLLSCFKEELLRFFFKQIKSQIYAPVIGNKLLYNANDSKCKKL